MTQIADASPSPEYANAAPTWRREAVDIERTLAVAMVLALIVRIVLFQPFTIPSSLEPGLETGDYVVVSMFAYGWSTASLPFSPPIASGRLLGRSPARGDVVVFRLPRNPKEAWIKRVIGLPGDRVQVRGVQVFVNGKAVRRQPLGTMQDQIGRAHV